MYPKKITPNPLVSSTIEIRFKTDKECNTIFKLFFGKLSDKLPDFENATLPKELRAKHAELKYYPDYIFSNTDYSISFNENFISFENLTEYQLWENYYGFFNEILQLILGAGVIEQIERIGVRYQSRFNVEDFSSVINHVPSMNIGMEVQKNDFISYTSKIKSDGYDLLLRLKNNITESIFDSDEEQGHLIDIDVSISESLNHGQITICVNKAHELLKKLFFGLLKEDFIKTLNPEY